MNYKNTVTFVLLAFLITSVSAQRKMDKKYDLLKSKRVSYFTEKLELSPEVAEKFWPLYNDLDKERISGHIKMRKLVSEYDKLDKTKVSDEQYLNLADAMIDSRLEAANLEKSYHEKFKAILSPKQLVNFYKVDQNFRKEMLKMFRDGHNRGKGRQRDGHKSED